MTALRAMVEDYRRYCKCFGMPRRFFLFNVIRLLVSTPGYAAVIAYRFGRYARCEVRFKPYRLLLKLVNFPFFMWARSYSGAEILPEMDAGPGFVVVHFGGIIFSPKAKIGRNFMCHQNCCIVEWHSAAATIGDDVYVGSNAVFVGPCAVGNNVLVGAGAVVTGKFGDNVILAGSPAKVVGEIEPKQAGEEQVAT